MVEPDPGEGEGLILRGSIEETSVPELLKSVLGSGETGVLTFRKGDITKSVHLHMGRVVYARSSDPDERLGEDLLLRGKISVRQYLDASQLNAEPVSLHLRYLQTLVEIAAEKNSTIIFPVPIDWLKALMGGRGGEAAASEKKA